MWSGTSEGGVEALAGGQPVVGTACVCEPTPPTHTPRTIPRLLAAKERSHERKDPVDEESHDSSTEQPGHGHRHEPGHEDVAEEAPVHGLPRADPAHRHHRAHLAVCGADWQPDVGGDDHGEGRGQFDGEAAGRRDGGEVLPHGLDHSSPPHPEARTNSNPSIKQQPDGSRGFLQDRTLFINQPQSHQGPDGITHIISAMREGAEAGGEDLQEVEEQVHLGRKVFVYKAG